MKTFLLLMLFLGTNSFASSLRPPSLVISGKKFVFLDFKEAIHEIVYDMSSQNAFVYSLISFDMPEQGYPIYDQVENPEFVNLNGEAVEVFLVDIELSMYRNTKVRAIGKEIAVGNHTILIKTPLKKLVEFKTTSEGKSVSSAFWLSDLDDRHFMEKYLPSSFEYDQLNLSLFVRIVGTEIEHKLVTNGYINNISKNNWTITYPQFYTSSSVFFHLYPDGSKKELKKTFKSIDNRLIDVFIYSELKSWHKLEDVYSLTIEYMQELESLYGPWPHDANIIYIAGLGGMEYSGATMTSLAALRHELNHYYFARNVMPARGNAGWIDEAIASWADDKYPRKTLPSKALTASHSVYSRTTDRRAYTLGANLMGHMDSLFKNQGGLRSFLKYYFEKRRETVISTMNFQNDLEEYFNTDMQSYFDQYVYGKETIEEQGYLKRPSIEDSSLKRSNHLYHVPFNENELRKLL
jgi:hypothetical protein